MNNKIYDFIIIYNLKSHGLIVLKMCEKAVQQLNSRFIHDIIFTGVKVTCSTSIVSLKSATMRMVLILGSTFSKNVIKFYILFMLEIV